VPRLIELGRATTHGQALPLGVDDPVVAARAVRRALAAARSRAADVSRLVVATAEPVPNEVLAAFARRALGPHGAHVGTAVVVTDARDAGTLADQAVARIRADPSSAGVAIAVGLGTDGTVEARCLR
jgi:hypothetical protein